MKALSETKKVKEASSSLDVDSDGEELHEEEKEYFDDSREEGFTNSFPCLRAVIVVMTSPLGKSNGHGRRKVVVIFQIRNKIPPKNCCLRKIYLKPTKIYKVIKTSHVQRQGGLHQCFSILYLDLRALKGITENRFQEAKPRIFSTLNLRSRISLIRKHKEDLRIQNRNHSCLFILHGKQASGEKSSNPKLLYFRGKKLPLMIDQYYIFVNFSV